VDGGLREQHKARTRERLATTALSLFEQRGFDEVTVEEVAEAAMVSTRTFYRYFGSKEAVLYRDQDDRQGLVREAILDHPAEDPPIAAVCAGVLVLATLATGEVDLARRQMRLIASTESLGAYERTTLLPRWEDVIAEAVATRLGVDLDADVRPRLLAGVGMAVMISLGQTFRLDDGPADLEARVLARFAELRDLVQELAAAADPPTDRPGAA
jgi:AcrR family transcriptional regulator